MIIGRDILEELGIDLVFSEGLLRWDNATVPMRDVSWLDEQNLDLLEKEILSVHGPDTTEVERIQDIQDLKYAPADLEVIAAKCGHLMAHEQYLLFEWIKNKYEALFDGSLGIWGT